MLEVSVLNGGSLVKGVEDPVYCIDHLKQIPNKLDLTVLLFLPENIQVEELILINYLTQYRD